jgi:N-acyl-D-aspartate/D-glutamate deacylase
VIPDTERIRDKATYFEPLQYSEGIDPVWVNGTLVVDEGKPTGARPGKVLSRQRRRKSPTQ